MTDLRSASPETQTTFTVPGLDRTDGDTAVSALEPRLVSLLDLGLTLKHIHWNVVGPTFIAVHQMLDPQYAAVADMADEIAERIAALGGSPNGLPGHLVEARTWNDYPVTGRAIVETHLEALDDVYSGVISDHRDVQARLSAADPVTEDLIISQIRALEQFQWFVRAHLERPDGSLGRG